MCEENHIVKRAIIMAAGFGNRMYPLTLTTPKPLVKVNGVRMIDTVVDGLRSNGWWTACGATASRRFMWWWGT